jgi:hypothetical protein
VAETFFYLLDVGTSNALVLYNESMKSRCRKEQQHTPMNIVEFKMKLVEDLVGRSIDNLFKGKGWEESSTPLSMSKVGNSCSVHTVH